LNYRQSEWVTRSVVAVVGTATVIFAVAFGYVVLQAFLDSSFNVSLTANPGSFEHNFTIYGFVSIEATFLAIMAFFGYSILKNATRRKVIEVEVEN
jgi:hypothetical protein